MDRTRRGALHRTRRAFLGAAGGGVATVAGGGVATLAGCLGGRSTDVVRLETLAVGGSPGGTVPVGEPGTVSLADFFATWCAPCRPQMANLNALRDSFGADELHLVSVTQETDRAAVRRFWREYDGSWPVALDPDLEAARAYDVRGVPTLVLVDEGGETVWRHRGLAGEEQLREQVRGTLA